MESFNSIKVLVEGVQADIDKFEAGNKAAGQRIRASMQQIKQCAQQVRKDVQEKKAQMKKGS